MSTPNTGSAASPGLLVVYTGHGKGKTTAALGMVFRALGRGLRVTVVQFIKGKWKTGERVFAESLPELRFLVMGLGFTWESDDISRDKAAARAAWAEAQKEILSGERELVVLDELTYAFHYGFRRARRGAGDAALEANGRARGDYWAGRARSADRAGRSGYGDEAREASVPTRRKGPPGGRLLMAASLRAVPRLVIAGVSSGVGKTTVTVALARALISRGLRVALFKCGPDYLDPTYHARALGHATQNLDGWMMGREAVCSTFLEATRRRRRCHHRGRHGPVRRRLADERRGLDGGDRQVARGARGAGRGRRRHGAQRCGAGGRVSKVSIPRCALPGW